MFFSFFFMKTPKKNCILKTKGRLEKRELLTRLILSDDNYAFL